MTPNERKRNREVGYMIIIVSYRVSRESERKM